MLGSALLPLIAICALTGFSSHIAYYPGLGENSVVGEGGIGFDLYLFDWPTSPSWLYALTQGLHIVSGVAAIPILLAKLWSAMPKLFEWPPFRSPAHLLDRISLALLVGGSIFVFFTGILNIQNWYPWAFSFVPSHYYGAFIFLAALALHLITKLPVALRAFRQRGVLKPLRDDREHTEPEPSEEGTTAPTAPGPVTMSRRLMLGTVGAGSLGLAAIAAGQSIGGPLRSIAILAPRGSSAVEGANGFPVNKTAASAEIDPADTGGGWRLELIGESRLKLSRDDLLAFDQHTVRLPIACVEGWSTTQEWTGVPLGSLAAIVRAAPGSTALVESLQRIGVFKQATLSPSQIGNPDALLALRVNGEDLSPDHGFPARVVVPAAPGVHCTKWVDSIEFEAA